MNIQRGVRWAGIFKSDLGASRRARHRTVADDLNSTNAMTADPNTLMAINANACTSDAPVISKRRKEA